MLQIDREAPKEDLFVWW